MKRVFESQKRRYNIIKLGRNRRNDIKNDKLHEWGDLWRRKRKEI